MTRNGFSGLFYSLICLTPLAFAVETAAQAVPPRECRVGPEFSTTFRLRNVSAATFLARVLITPQQPASRGVLSKWMKIKAGKEMLFDLRYFLPDPLPAPMQGTLQVIHRGPPEDLEVEVEVMNRQTGEVESWPVATTQDGSTLDGNPAPICPDCPGGTIDPLYQEFATWEFKVWDVTGDGIPDPYLESTFVVFDSNGVITFTDTTSKAPAS